MNRDKCFNEVLKLQRQIKDLKREINELRHPDFLYDEDGNVTYIFSKSTNQWLKVN